VKLAGLQGVIASDLTEGDKLFLIDVIETYLPREQLADAGEEIMQALLETELTWGEKRELKGKLEGEIEGEIRGKQEILLRLLRSKFGSLPEPFVQQLTTIDDPAVLDELSEQVLMAVTLDDITLPESKPSP
jgi:hypothetical protein